MRLSNRSELVDTTDIVNTGDTTDTVDTGDTTDTDDTNDTGDTTDTYDTVSWTSINFEFIYLVLCCFIIMQTV